MRKLEHDLVIKIPSKVQEELQKSEYDFPDLEECIVEIYHVEDREDEEVYRINIPALDDDFNIAINSVMMDVSRQIQEEGGGPIEEFIMHLVMGHLKQDAEEEEIRDFFEDISD